MHRDLIVQCKCCLMAAQTSTNMVPTPQESVEKNAVGRVNLGVGVRLVDDSEKRGQEGPRTKAAGERRNESISVEPR